MRIPQRAAPFLQPDLVIVGEDKLALIARPQDNALFILYLLVGDLLDLVHEDQLGLAIFRVQL